MLKRFIAWLFPPSTRDRDAWPDPDIHAYDRPILPSLVLGAIVIIVFALIIAFVFPA